MGGDGENRWGRGRDKNQQETIRQQVWFKEVITAIAAEKLLKIEVVVEWIITENKSDFRI